MVGAGGGAAAGSGGSVGLIDRAETFTDPDLTLTHTKTEVAGGNVRLVPSKSSTADGGSADNSETLEQEDGVRVEIKEDITQLSATLFNNGGTVDSARVIDADDGTHYDGKSGSWSGGDTITFDVNVPAGTNLEVRADNSGAYFETGYAHANFPISSQFVDITRSYGAYDADNQTDLLLFREVSVTTKATTSGTVYVKWPYPDDPYAWDRALFQTLPDGETVEVYIEENQSGGWTEIAGPIERGASIEADPANNVRYRVELSRSDTANNPQLETLYRRYVI